MGLSLITELPSWFILFCLAAGLLYAFLLYRNDSISLQVSETTKRILFASRAVLVTLLAFLLLGPMLRTVSREIEKPLVVVAIDASESILNSRDSVSVRDELKKASEILNAKLGKDYEVKTYAFGDHARENFNWNFTDKATDFSQLYDLLDVNYTNRNVGALVIASDGLYNEGSNPVYGPQRVKAPVYTIAVGDTTVRKDLSISKIISNRTAYLGNNFPIEVQLDAHQCSGSTVTVRIAEDSAEVFNRTLNISSNSFHLSIPALIEAKKKGIRHYVVSVTVLDGEVTAANNKRDLFIEIVENKQKILILSNAPHPDIAALKNSIETSPNYEVALSPVNEWQGRASAFNLVIVHNLPSTNVLAEAVIKQFQDAGVAVWFILGASTNITSFNALNTGVEIQAPSPLKMNEVIPVSDPQFSLFSLSSNFQDAVVTWPPLSSPFGVYSSKGNIYNLLYQKVGAVNTRQPLLYFSSAGKQKIAVLTGEGMWRWSLMDFNLTGSHDRYNELVSKIIQYLIVRENTSPFRVYVHNPVNENESIVFDAELYNKADELVNEPEARITITDFNNKDYPYTFSRTARAYTLNAGQFSSGRYRYKAEVKSGDQLLRAEGEFSVNSLQTETATTVADHQVLYALANRTGGAMFAPAQAEALAEAIRNREDVKAVSYSHKKLTDLVNMPWFLVVLMGLLSLEWLIRKRSGSY